ncbi:hypothetical protein [uncultured Microbacterium sp.]|uniref:hypothetical protein n=1 Tax=uncultured Microbacterium sp. TaxID=191216 RepID=UPI00261A8D90|nr:hypothetical protein [uncultured Microbacterium sp.]
MSVRGSRVNEIDVHLAKITAHGGALVAASVLTDWGHYTAFFADPEGNIHSLFAVAAG